MHDPAEQVGLRKRRTAWHRRGEPKLDERCRFMPQSSANLLQEAATQDVNPIRIGCLTTWYWTLVSSETGLLP